MENSIKKIILVTLIVNLMSSNYLQSKNLSMDATNPFGWTSIADAVAKISPLSSQTDFDAFTIFLQTQNEESINKLHRFPLSGIWQTALMYACKYTQNLPLVIALLDAGADCNKLSSQDKTALEIAAYHQHTEMVIALLRAGANVNIGHPLIAACRYTRPGGRGVNPEIIAKLLRAGADVNDVNTSHEGLTPLLAASIKSGNDATKIVEMFIRVGADVDQGDENAITPLYTACEVGNLGTIKLLLRAGANPNTRDNWTRATPLFAAENPEVAQLLINAGADITLKDTHGETAFAKVCRGESTPGLATVFLEAGADPKERFNSSTPLHIAARSGNIAAVEEILAFKGKKI